MARPEDKTVLVVDDEPDVRGYLRMILEDAGFRVETAGDGEEALERIRARPPDFVSLDLVMPRRSGQRLLFELKRDRDLCRIPVLIVTAHARDDLGRQDLEDILDRAVMSGPGTYLEKPVNPESYVQAVARAVGIELPARTTPRAALEAELEHSVAAASPDALREALAVLRRAKTKGGREGGE
jgi:CheY-like chemotaxis protein